MALRSPASGASFRVRFAAFDFAWALASPPIALLLRDAQALNTDDVSQAVLYCAVVFGVSLLCFVFFRLHESVTEHFSVYDAINIAKIVVSTTLVSSTVLFLFTRLDGVPRSTPAIHALVLAAGLMGARLLYVFVDRSRVTSMVRRQPDVEHIIMVAGTRLSSLYISFLEAYSEQTRYKRQVVGLLDDRADLVGHTIGGVRVTGTTGDLSRVIDEFQVHGIKVDRVIVGGDSSVLSEETLKDVEEVCARRSLEIDFVPNLIGLQTPTRRREPLETETASRQSAALALPGYFKIKPVFDVLAATTLILLLAPVWLVIGLLVLIDVGLPVLFWQQRIGRHGRLFMLHKFRTMRAPFDWRGDAVPEDARQSKIGLILRAVRFDELPQLLNVFVTEMSLIGPRPLLPNDQPARPEVRLSVRPGITGWAQVNGGRLLTPEEKDELDEWYIRNASFGLDLKILWKTAMMIFRGDHRSEAVLAQARSARPNPSGGAPDRNGLQPPRAGTVQSPAAHRLG